MKYVITESQFGKIFKREGDEGPLTNVIYSIIEDVLNEPIVCDYVVTYVEGRGDFSEMYAILILTKLPMSSSFERKVANLVKNFIGISPLVLVNDNYECEKPQN